MVRPIRLESQRPAFALRRMLIFSPYVLLKRYQRRNGYSNTVVS
jgi:hypothetical protein